MAPEMWRGGSQQAYHPAPADMWSLGVLLMGLLTGYGVRQRSRSGADIMEWPPGFHSLSASAQLILMAMLQPVPGDRSTARELLPHKWLEAHRDTERRSD